MYINPLNTPKNLLFLCEQKHWQLISSEIVEFEISNTPDEGRRKELKIINGLASSIVDINDIISSRAKEFENMGLQAFDALHLACSENRADVMLTVDDQFLKNTLKIQDLKIKVSNPLKWLEEVLL